MYDTCTKFIKKGGLVIDCKGLDDGNDVCVLPGINRNKYIFCLLSECCNNVDNTEPLGFTAWCWYE